VILCNNLILFKLYMSNVNEYSDVKALT